MKKFLGLVILNLISCFYCTQAMEEDKKLNSPKSSIAVYEKAIKKLDEYKEKLFGNDTSLQQTFLRLLAHLLNKMPVTKEDATKNKTYLNIVNLCIKDANLINTYEGYLKIILEFLAENLKRLKEIENLEEKK